MITMYRARNTIGGLFLLLIVFGDIQAQAIGIKIELILPATLGQDGCNIPRVLDPLEIDVAARLLNGVSNQLGRTGFSLCSHYHGLFLLAGFVDDECGSLGLLLGNLLGLDSGGELGRKGEML